MCFMVMVTFVLKSIKVWANFPFLSVSTLHSFYIHRYALMPRGGTFQVWNLKKLKECSNFCILEGTYGMYFELTVSGRNLKVGTFQKWTVELTYIWNFEILFHGTRTYHKIHQNFGTYPVHFWIKENLV